MINIEGYVVLKSKVMDSLLGITCDYSGMTFDIGTFTKPNHYARLIKFINSNLLLDMEKYDGKVSTTHSLSFVGSLDEKNLPMFEMLCRNAALAEHTYSVSIKMGEFGISWCDKIEERRWCIGKKLEEADIKIELDSNFETNCTDVNKVISFSRNPFLPDVKYLSSITIDGNQVNVRLHGNKNNFFIVKDMRYVLQSNFNVILTGHNFASIHLGDQLISEIRRLE